MALLVVFAEAAQYMNLYHIRTLSFPNLIQISFKEFVIMILLRIRYNDDIDLY